MNITLGKNQGCRTESNNDIHLSNMSKFRSEHSLTFKCWSRHVTLRRLHRDEQNEWLSSSGEATARLFSDQNDTKMNCDVLLRPSLSVLAFHVQIR